MSVEVEVRTQMDAEAEAFKRRLAIQGMKEPEFRLEMEARIN